MYGSSHPKLGFYLDFTSTAVKLHCLNPDFKQACTRKSLQVNRNLIPDSVLFSLLYVAQVNQPARQSENHNKYKNNSRPRRYIPVIR